MEHPRTLLLGKVLQSNIALGNAHVNNAERSKIINRWMDLQQSINVLFDCKTASIVNGEHHCVWVHTRCSNLLRRALVRACARLGSFLRGTVLNASGLRCQYMEVRKD